MKKHNIHIRVLSIAFSVMFLVVAFGTKSEAQDGDKKAPDSLVHIKATSPLDPKDNFRERKDNDITPPRTLFIPVKEGLHAFLDLTSPSHPGIAPTDSLTDYRTVVGFHFRIK
jgi:hypothetical protein